MGVDRPNSATEPTVEDRVATVVPDECPRPRWARPVRRVLLCAIGLLYVASIPWYRSGASAERILGLPDWVAVAILCYAAAAVLNSAAWLLTDIPESGDIDEARGP